MLVYTYIYIYILVFKYHGPGQNKNHLPKASVVPLVSSLPRHGVLKLLQHRALTGSPHEFQSLLVQLDHHYVRVHRRNGRDHVALLTETKTWLFFGSG